MGGTGGGLSSLSVMLLDFVLWGLEDFVCEFSEAAVLVVAVGVASDSMKMDSPRRRVVRNGVGDWVHTGWEGMSKRSFAWLFWGFIVGRILTRFVNCLSEYNNTSIPRRLCSTFGGDVERPKMNDTGGKGAIKGARAAFSNYFNRSRV